ncbi:aspartic proteinase 36-like [Solanum lycopersicum]|uniref:aspartic proteinase 36-like n=1 Tax=Solanum lycopersicum TaxID=4081 RepID=UPI000532B83E|nr:aspartic proteinase-like protein 2 [Solanum lycopersicum]
MGSSRAVVQSLNKNFTIPDNSGLLAYFASDLFYFHKILRTSLIAKSSTTIIFGGHYNVYLQSIFVHERILPIDPEAFANSGDRGTIVDFDTSLVYLVTEAYESVVNAINVVVSPSAKQSHQQSSHAISFLQENIAEVFPTISLNFAGDASMNLTPTDYFKDMGFVDGAAKWCIHFIRRNLSLTTLGDIVLKDRIIVYDLARQRIGWVHYL